MSPQEAIAKAGDMCTRAETCLAAAIPEASANVDGSWVAAAQVYATLGEAYARIGSATVVLATSEHDLAERRIAATAGMPGVRA